VIVQALVKQLQGKMTVDTTNGMRVSITRNSALPAIDKVA
jgi:hypothetical protein